MSYERAGKIPCFKSNLPIELNKKPEKKLWVKEEIKELVALLLNIFKYIKMSAKIIIINAIN